MCIYLYNYVNECSVSNLTVIPDVCKVIWE